MSGAATGPEQIAEMEQAALLLPCSLARRVLSPALQESVNVHAQLRRAANHCRPRLFEWMGVAQARFAD